MTTFAKLWDLHWQWRKGFFLKNILSGATMDVYQGIPHDYYSIFAVPKVADPGALDFREVTATTPSDLRYAIHLNESHKANGYYEFLTKRGYYYQSAGTWLVYTGPLRPSLEHRYPHVVPITAEHFSDYTGVLDAVDAEDPHHPRASVPYYTAQRHILEAQENTHIRIEFFGIYEAQQAVSVGALIYSQRDNFAWLPRGAIRKHQRDAGEYSFRYPLLQQRLDRALALGITTIYAITDFGSFEWSDLLQMGFDQVQEVRIFLNFIPHRLERGT
jgi:N-acetylglutamate synthase-like GNAT family acetyltransferase